MRWSQLTFTIICVHVSVCVRHWILLTHQEWRSALFSSPGLFQPVSLGFTGAKNTTCHNGVCQVEEVVKVLGVGSVNIPGIFSACSPKLNFAGVEFGRSTLEIISCMMWSSVRYWWRDKEISTFNYLLTHLTLRKEGPTCGKCLCKYGKRFIFLLWFLWPLWQSTLECITRSLYFLLRSRWRQTVQESVDWHWHCSQQTTLNTSLFKTSKAALEMHSWSDTSRKYACLCLLSSVATGICL